jgi:preprotein translocase subunit SecA
VQISNSRHRRVQNITGWRQRLAHLQGSPVTFDLRAYNQELAEINRLGIDIERLSDGEIEARAHELREQAGARIRAVNPDRGSPTFGAERRGASLESIRAAFFALARDASRRVLGLRPFNVQVLAAIALDCGHIVEMQTGEGKTLAAVMPASLRALTGQGVHILTFNDYLARRDAEWMDRPTRCSDSGSGSFSRA